MMRRKLIALTAAGIALGTTAPADAQVFVDPGSPSGKEYGIPLEDARREASEGGNDELVPQGERSAPIFGEGVGPDRPDTNGKQDAGDDDPSPRGSEGQGGDETVKDAGGGDVGSIDSSRTVVATVPQGGFSDTLTIGAVALSVLLLGGVIGSIARRRSF